MIVNVEQSSFSGVVLNVSRLVKIKESWSLSRLGFLSKGDIVDRVANRPEFFRTVRNFLVLFGKRRLTFPDSTMTGKSSRCYHL